MRLLKHMQICSIVKSTQHLDSRLIHLKKSAMNGEKIAYFHELDDCNKFKRNTIETIECFVSRVKANLEKIIMPKIKKKQKKTDDKGENCDVSVQLITKDGSVVPDTSTCKDIFFSNKYPYPTLVLRMIGLDYIVAINHPWIDLMKLPSSMMAGFPVYPNSFETRFTDKSLSIFLWSKLLTKNHDVSSTEENQKVKKIKQEDNWSAIGEGFIYTPTVEDIGCKLKVECIPKNSSTIGPTVQHESASIVEAGPGYCPFDERHLYTQNNTTEGSFRIVSYNILADVYSSTDTAQNELFNYCPQYALNIDYRKQLFLKELLGYNADVICLQEVDTKVFDSDLVPVLEEQGLVGVHAKKSTISEGVCTFYSSNKFKLLGVEEVVLAQELTTKQYCAHILACVETNQQLKDRISGLGTAAQALILESVERPGELVVLGNTHLYFHPDADHIRLVQAGILLGFLSSVVDDVKQKRECKAVSLICCGDFNSVPECGIYQLFTSNTVLPDYKDWTSKPEEEVKGLSLSQPFSMQSACGIPDYTNYTVSFAACLDYIYYQTDRFTVEAMVPLPSDDVLREHRAIPSVVFPSDHVALIADLKWSKN